MPLFTYLWQTKRQTRSHLICVLASVSISQTHRFVKSALRHPVQAVGGDEGIRTPGLLRAREALSQLSYIPRMLRWAILDLNQRPFPYQRNALAD